MSIDEKIKPTVILENPWRNAYWFARMLINGDKYGAVGKDTKLLSRMAFALRTILEDSSCDDFTKINLSHKVISELLNDRFAKRTAKTERIDLFFFRFNKKVTVR